MNASAVILAGGKSSRMGFDKSLLPLGQQSMIERIIELIRPLFDELIIVSNKENKYAIPGVKEVVDIFPNKGPLGGIHAGLSAAIHSSVFIISCDMPFFNPQLIQQLFAGSQGFDASVCKINGRLEPLCAFYNQSSLPYIEACLKRDMCAVHEIFAHLWVHYLTEESIYHTMQAEWVFFNVNTPQDYQLLLEAGKVV